jgi:hypothetical protein
MAAVAGPTQEATTTLENVPTELPINLMRQKNPTYEERRSVLRDEDADDEKRS